MSIASVVPDLIDALFDQATEKLPPEVHVWDGYPVTENPGALVLMVGIDDPESDVAANAAHSEKSWPHAGRRATDEEGEITLAASARNGDGNARAARRAAYDLVDAVAGFLQEDPTVGVDGVLSTTLGSDSELLQDQYSGGASATVVFKVAFKARRWTP